MRILVTGFMPFGGQSVNPSWEAVSRLSEFSYTADIRLARLPVEWGACAETLRAEIAAFRPDIALLTGQAGGREGVSVERVAYNSCDCAAPDNAGVVLRDTPVRADGPDSLFADYPYEALLSALTQAGITARYSFDAGRFLCNYALYTALDLAVSEYRGMRAGFLHLPYLPGQKKEAPCMKLEEQLRALDIAVRVCSRD